ncbi:hypothetical protein GN958_ATG20120, partial [Phytophthora infestans]
PAFSLRPSCGKRQRGVEIGSISVRVSSGSGDSLDNMFRSRRGIRMIDNELRILAREAAKADGVPVNDTFSNEKWPLKFVRRHGDQKRNEEFGTILSVELRRSRLLASRTESTAFDMCQGVPSEYFALNRSRQRVRNGVS